MPRTAVCARLDMTPLQIRRFQLSRSLAARTSIGCGKRSIAKARRSGRASCVRRAGELLLKARAFQSTPSSTKGAPISPSRDKIRRNSKRRRRRNSYDEGVDEPAKLIEIESVKVEAEVPAEENEPVETIKPENKPEAAFETTNPSR